MVEIDTRRQRLRIHQIESGLETWEAYDQLMIGTGARPICPDIPGIDAGGIFGVNGLQSAIDIQSELDLTDAKRVVVVGGGYIGLEMAEAMALRGIKVALVEQASEVMNTLDIDMVVKVSQALEDGGVKLYREEELEGIRKRQGSGDGRHHGSTQTYGRHRHLGTWRSAQFGAVGGCGYPAGGQQRH